MKILLVHPGADVSTADVHSALTKALTKRGHELWHYALNARIAVAGMYLHYAWKKGGKKCDKPTPADVLYKAGEELVARALRLQPDVILIVSAMYVHPDVFVLMHRAGLPVTVLFTESPYDDDKQKLLLPYIRLAWTNERVSAKALGIRYLAHAYDAETHHAGPPSPRVPAHDVLLVGTGFQERIDLLGQVDWAGIDLALYGSWDLLGSRNKLRQYVKGPQIENAVVADLYKRAKICLNLYRESVGFGKHAPRTYVSESMNPRAYELAATGSFCVSSHRQEVIERFGALVPLFKDAKELEIWVRQYLADDVGRARIQVQLPACVKGHTWDDRVLQIESDLDSAGLSAHRAERIFA